MRVISGSARSLRLKTLPDESIRPTSDRNKETLFNIINPYILNCSFLDLFAGSGAIGIEALSRGAAFALFIDKSKKACDIVRENLSHCKLAYKAKVVNGDFRNVLPRLSEKFDVIFIDPPFDASLECEALDIIEKNDLLCDDGIIIIEARLGQEISLKEDSGLIISRIKEYKNVKHVFINRKGDR